MARANIEAFEAEPDLPIVVTAAGCGSTLKEYGHLLKDDPQYAERAHEFANRVKDFSEFVAAREQGIAGPNAAQGHLSGCVPSGARAADYRATPHTPEIYPRSRDRRNAGIVTLLWKRRIYNILRPEMARKLGERKVGHILETGATEVITANPGCAIQIATLLREADSDIKVTHIADFLDEAYSATPSQVGD